MRLRISSNFSCVKIQMNDLMKAKIIIFTSLISFLNQLQIRAPYIMNYLRSSLREFKETHSNKRKLKCFQWNLLQQNMFQQCILNRRVKYQKMKMTNKARLQFFLYQWFHEPLFKTGLILRYFGKESYQEDLKVNGVFTQHILWWSLNSLQFSFMTPRKLN